MTTRSRATLILAILALAAAGLTTTAVAGARQPGDRGGSDGPRPAEAHESASERQDDGGDAGEDRDRRGRSNPCRIEGRRQVESATAKLIVEYNATDGDLGVHGMFDDSGWTRLCVLDPRGRRLLDVRPNGQLRDLSIGSMFFESREPTLDVFGFDELRSSFPEGSYPMFGAAIDGSVLAGEAVFTHDVPAEPEITAPAITEDEEAAGDVIVQPTGVVVAWEPVTETVFGGPVTITGYQVIITEVDFDDPNGFSLPVYDVHVGPDSTSLGVPDEFFEPATLYELEVLALEESGNQTIALGFFTTA